MIRLSKLADYGMMLMGQIAAHQDRCMSALELAEETHVPLPTVSKVLTVLTRAKLLKSQRGAKGGYVLARPAREISVAEIVGALDGPIALTQCIEHGPTHRVLGGDQFDLSLLAFSFIPQGCGNASILEFKW